MNEPQEHSEGPWASNGFLVLSKDLSTVCHTGGTKFKDGRPAPYEAEANARLIATAPCLLAALEDLLNHTCTTGYYSQDDSEDVINARAAIAKAKGTP